MTDLYIDHRFHLNDRRLHHFLPLGQVFEAKPCGCCLHKDSLSSHCKHEPVVVHSAQPMPPGWNDMMDEVRANMTEAGLIS